ncbi:hypothetical protein [Burkholderia ambifaria]|uniref:hypothetical protein n=1 Tax=Burkholderia ambifaria TaxID=152480 RepID=UPI002FE07692
MVEILEGRSTVVAHSLVVAKSNESLSAIKLALSKIGTAVSQKNDPKAWDAGTKYWYVDAVFASGNDLWTVAHEQLEPGDRRTSPEMYMVTHVRREWLDFSKRDLNTCTPIPDNAMESGESAAKRSF